jgi:GntP family gluconate:H+ symporter
MYGMPLAQALVFLTSVVVLILATQWRPFHPFIMLVVIAAVFGYIAGYPTSQLGSLFGSGFAEKFYSPGLVIVAASLIAGLAETTAAADRLMAKLDRWRWLGSDRIAAGLGLIAGIGASPASAFALLTPLIRPIAGDGQSQERDAERNTQRDTLALALSVSASHGLLLLSPVPIAAAAIIGAEWNRVALFGLPLAILLAACGAILARWLSLVGAAPELLPAGTFDGAAKRSDGNPIVLLLAIAIPLLLLMVQSIGDIPSEPLGGGPTRELVLGIGRPLILFLVGVGVMLIGQLRRGLNLFADPVWTGRIFSSVSSILLIVCAAGGLQSLCQQTGMAEMVGERLLAWHLGASGVLIPFLIAAIMKTLQGSSLVAAITTAGMVQPILLTLGLDDGNGRALAALAVGAGAMTISHINDDYFWLVADRAALTPLRAIARFSTGTLLQGLVAAVALLAISLLTSHA